jgi:hypothetical protein
MLCLHLSCCLARQLRTADTNEEASTYDLCLSHSVQHQPIALELHFSLWLQVDHCCSSEQRVRTAQRYQVMTLVIYDPLSKSNVCLRNDCSCGDRWPCST